MDYDFVPALNLDEDIEGWGCAALAYRLLRAPTTRLDVAERHRLDAAYEVGQCGVHDEVVECIAVRGGNELDAPLGDGACCVGVGLSADLVDDDDLGHVVLDCLYHHGVLEGRGADLHAARPADAGMWDVAVSGYLVGGVHDDDALEGVVGKNARNLAQHSGLAHAGLAEQ